MEIILTISQWRKLIDIVIAGTHAEGRLGLPIEIDNGDQKIEIDGGEVKITLSD